MEKEFWQAYKAKGVVVIGISTYAQDNPLQRAKEFVQKHKLSFPILVDAENKVAETYNIMGVPTNVVIGKDGKVLYLQAGFDDQGIKQAIESALKQ